MPKARRDTLHIDHVGPIDSLRLDLGDLTLLVGPQGTGKSIALQLFKLTQDRLSIAKTARTNGLVWQSAQEFLDVYLGAGIGTSWGKRSRLGWKGNDLSLPPQMREHPGEPTVCYVPAQRALTLADGWPRPFGSYPNAPYVVREFGQLLQRILLRSRGEKIFPPSDRLKADLRKSIDHAIFHTGTLQLRRISHQRELRLIHAGADLPYMAWSAGQREYVPLLLALYDLLPPTARTKHPSFDWVILEEPEMGLHPEGIRATAALIMELLHRGYRVIVSTHHPLMLDFVWLIQELQQRPDARPRDLLAAVGLQARGDAVRMAQSVLEKDCRTYSLHHETDGVVATDISSLDPAAEDLQTAGWGGLTSLSEHMQQIVARVVQRGGHHDA